MSDRIITALFLLAVTAAPAFAAPTVASSLPEPASMTLFGLGIGGAYIAKKIIGRK